LVIYPNGFYSDNTVVIPALDQIGVRYLVSYFVFALHILPLLKSLRVFFPLQINIAEANANCKYLFNIFLYFLVGNYPAPVRGELGNSTLRGDGEGEHHHTPKS
jgi:hypothetical protein